MCFWQSKYSERGSYRIGNTATEVKANISTRIGLVLLCNSLKIGLTKSCTKIIFEKLGCSVVSLRSQWFGIGGIATNE